MPHHQYEIKQKTKKTFFVFFFVFETNKTEMETIKKEKPVCMQNLSKTAIKKEIKTLQTPLK